MSDSSQTTTDHDKIKSWVEDRGGHPATVSDTKSGDEPGMIRVEFSDNDGLEKISWEDFFGKFEESDLAFLYQDKTSDGEKSNFCKLVSR